MQGYIHLTADDVQVCWGKPSLVAFLVQQARAVMKAQPWATRFSVTQNDNWRFCQDPDELAIIEEEARV
eukprot:COSAG05_NODE_1473_length_4788_cov_2.548305_6_plen_69_part_00